MNSRHQLQHKLFLSLRLSLRDASCYSLMVGMGEAYIAAFVLALGFSAIDAGLISTIPIVVGSAIQLMLVWTYKHISSYRKWVMNCACVQAATLFILASLPLWAPHRLELIYIMTAAYWAAAFSSGPAWNAWMGALVPPRLRIQFFSERSRRVQIFTYSGIFTAGIILYYAEKLDVLLYSFSFLLVSAGVARLFSAYYISKQIEKPKDRLNQMMTGKTHFLTQLKTPKLIIILSYLFTLQLSVYIAAPFFSPYMLKELQLDYFSYMFLSSTTFLARIIFYPYIQKIADEHGPLKLVWLGTACLMLSPILWTVSTNYYFLIGLQILSGIGWGMQELGIFLLLLDKFPTQERSAVLSFVNFLNSIGILIGSLVGSRIMNQYGISITTYYLLFTVSTLGRVCAALALPYLEDIPKERRFALFWRIVGLRPNLGAVMRPILYVGKVTRGRKKDAANK